MHEDTGQVNATRSGIVVYCAVSLGVACGARSELLIPTQPEDAGLDVHDAAPDVHDAAPDITDAPIIDDVTSGCDGGVTAYLWDVNGDLYTFDPTTLTTTKLGAVNCTGSLPWTFSVSRSGYALMIYEDWNIYRVDLSTLACQPTAFVRSQLGFDVQGEEAIAISRNPTTPEQLYVYGLKGGSTPTLAVADPTVLVVSEVGPVVASPELFPADMQGNANGRLFVLGEQGQLEELDSSNAAVLLDTQTSFRAGDWAVMTYGDQVFFFGDGNVSLEDIATQTLTPLGSTGIPVVGASAAPCVP